LKKYQKRPSKQEIHIKESPAKSQSRQDNLHQTTTSVMPTEMSSVPAEHTLSPGIQNDDAGGADEQKAPPVRASKQENIRVVVKNMEYEPNTFDRTLVQKRLDRRQSWGQSSSHSVSMLSPRVGTAQQQPNDHYPREQADDTAGTIIVGSEVIGSPVPKGKKNTSYPSKRKMASKAIIKMPPGTLDNRIRKKKSKFNIDLKGLGNSPLKR
jgi:hypothetical protein